MTSVIMHILDTRGRDYILDKMSNSNALSNILLETHDFNNEGEVYSVLPDGIVDHLYKFDEPIGMQTDSIETISGIIANHLNKNINNICIYEDPLINTGDPVLNELKSDWISYGDEIYWLNTGDNINIDIVKQTIYDVTMGWAFRGVLSRTNANIQKGTALKKSELEYISNNCSHIFLNAYDGDGFVFWSKYV